MRHGTVGSDVLCVMSTALPLTGSPKSAKAFFRLLCNAGFLRWLCRVCGISGRVAVAAAVHAAVRQCDCKVSGIQVAEQWRLPFIGSAAVDAI